MPVPAQTEAAWQQCVWDAARKLGWWPWHFHDSRRQVGGRLVGDAAAAGFPDLVLAHGRWGIVFAELKTDKGKLTQMQRDSLTRLAAAAAAGHLRCGDAGPLVHVWRPADLATVVIPVLRGLWSGGAVYGWEP